MDITYELTSEDELLLMDSLKTTFSYIKQMYDINSDNKNEKIKKQNEIYKIWKNINQRRSKEGRQCYILLKYIREYFEPYAIDKDMFNTRF